MRWRRNRSNNLIWMVVGGITLGVVAAGVLSNLQDIKRYIRISTM